MLNFQLRKLARVWASAGLRYYASKHTLAIAVLHVHAPQLTLDCFGFDAPPVPVAPYGQKILDLILPPIKALTVYEKSCIWYEDYVRQRRLEAEEAARAAIASMSLMVLQQPPNTCPRERECTDLAVWQQPPNTCPIEHECTDLTVWQLPANTCPIEREYTDLIVLNYLETCPVPVEPECMDITFYVPYAFDLVAYGYSSGLIVYEAPKVTLMSEFFLWVERFIDIVKPLIFSIWTYLIVLVSQPTPEYSSLAIHEINSALDTTSYEIFGLLVMIAIFIIFFAIPFSWALMRFSFSVNIRSLYHSILPFKVHPNDSSVAILVEAEASDHSAEPSRKKKRKHKKKKASSARDKPDDASSLSPALDSTIAQNAKPTRSPSILLAANSSLPVARRDDRLNKWARAKKLKDISIKPSVNPQRGSTCSALPIWAQTSEWKPTSNQHYDLD